MQMLVLSGKFCLQQCRSGAWIPVSKNYRYPHSVLLWSCFIMSANCFALCSVLYFLLFILCILSRRDFISLRNFSSFSLSPQLHSFLNSSHILRTFLFSGCSLTAKILKAIGAIFFSSLRVLFAVIHFGGMKRLLAEIAIICLHNISLIPPPCLVSTSSRT